MEIFRLKLKRAWVSRSLLVVALTLVTLAHQNCSPGRGAPAAQNNGGSYSGESYMTLVLCDHASLGSSDPAFEVTIHLEGEQYVASLTTPSASVDVTRTVSASGAIYSATGFELSVPTGPGPGTLILDGNSFDLVCR